MRDRNNKPMEGDEEQYEIVDVTIRYYTKKGGDPFGYSDVRFEVLDVDIPGPIHTSLMQVAIEDYAGIDISDYERFKRINKVSSWSPTQ